jgi:CheY-like chemotaxis protein/HPt (histidine-containing phosphotransfer) domain-containing protein
MKPEEARPDFPPSRASSSSDSVPASSRPRVLVAEDCPDSRQAVYSFLSRAGLDVTLAENGRVAVAVARAGRFDLVLLDMQMPEVDGYAAARQLRRDGFRGPVIALTGDVQPGDEQACHDAGCDAYLAKPWDPEELMRVLQTHIKFTRDRPKEEVSRPTSPDDRTLQQVAGEFARGLPRTVSEMSTALAAGDRSLVARLAHQASGAAGLFGFTEFCAAARQLEAAARKPEISEDKLGEQVFALGNLTRRIAPDPGEGR